MCYIAIRSGGNKNHGMGHVLRCIALAKELELNNFKVLFLVDNDDGVISFLNRYNFEFLNIISKNLESEILETKEILKFNNIKILITDSYCLSDNYFFEMKKICDYLISIDDNNLYNYISDIVINYNIYAKSLNYNFNSKTKFLLGCNYCLLREEFQDNKFIKINKLCKNVLITMGGSDINNFTYTLLNILKDFKDINFNVVVNNQFKNLEKLKILSYENFNINLIFNPSSMKNIMLKNDLAISASGSTTYELVSLLIPSILIIQADNQERIANEFSKLNTSICAGWFNEIDKESFKKSFIYLVNNYELRKKLSNNCKNVVCKTGVKNIVFEIKNLLKEG
ncbi:UDP-2,4-diacetamido-2,4,6-trideoxy-beta-L-altropyranose hydrolase [Paraclostridium sordellii]|uniref:UDP-2,4-diacetamido-2,4, 6-trideoxy-beta-L-altropyranose hydrolase n=1 Tax=Paraclostridium sordellii TaxID=1505 RepID=UPI0005DD844D|nr:UDP-2,4-diacetamido-2,4,6-trideoxy-beta-L-altropyranose hydrolase [Paeniclostridium sordellii]CEO20953.1 pseudaminic acid biosynthesis-associated protein PseG [[Clostridium] sordellii] [Paeniclostridium sordellii]